VRPLSAIAGGLAVLALAACGTDAPTVTGPSPTPTVTGTTPAPTASPTVAADQVLSFTYRGGVLTGPKGRVSVRRGSRVVLALTTDRAEEVHLHGYDLKVDVAKGSTGRLAFVADIAGVFEVELEGPGLLLCRLQVR
jgi:hypothetical protein